MKCFNAFTGKTEIMPCYSPTLASLRSPAKYWVISDAQLKRDLKGRTIKDVYRENRALRGVERSYVPRWESGAAQDGGLNCHRRTWHEKNAKPMSLLKEYLAWCATRGHTPHPASIDSDHPQNCHRETCPKVERVSPVAMEWSGMAGRMVPKLAAGQYFDERGA